MNSWSTRMVQSQSKFTQINHSRSKYEIVSRWMFHLPQIITKYTYEMSFEIRWGFHEEGNIQIIHHKLSGRIRRGEGSRRIPRGITRYGVDAIQSKGQFITVNDSKLRAGWIVGRERGGHSQSNSGWWCASWQSTTTCCATAGLGEADETRDVPTPSLSSWTSEWYPLT